MTATPTILTDARFFLDGCDLSWQNNEVEVKAERNVNNATTFRSDGWEENRGGQFKGDVSAKGFSAFGAAGTVDYDAWAALGNNAVMTAGALEATAGNPALLTKMMRAKYSPISGKPGELCAWSMEGQSAWPIVRGAFLLGPAVPLTDDGVTAALQLGAMTATQRLYATAHVVSAAGAAPTIDVTIKSDSVQNFGGTPEARLTIPQLTTVGGQIARTAEVGGAGHADTWYRAEYNISEVGDESLLVVIAIGIV